MNCVGFVLKKEISGKSDQIKVARRMVSIHGMLKKLLA